MLLIKMSENRSIDFIDFGPGNDFTTEKTRVNRTVRCSVILLKLIVAVKAGRIYQLLD